jgi:hypothetical protein
MKENQTMVRGNTIVAKSNKKTIDMLEKAIPSARFEEEKVVSERRIRIVPVTGFLS